MPKFIEEILDMYYIHYEFEELPEFLDEETVPIFEDAFIPDNIVTM